jgi:ABC-2 type transport system permease protein
MTQAPATATNQDQSGTGHSRNRASNSGLVAMWALYALTFRQHLHGRRWIVMAILFSLPAGLAVLLRATTNAPPVILEFLLAFMLIPHVLLPIVALVYAVGIIQDEQEEQTLTYLLIRPIPRWAIYAVKLLSTLTTTLLLTTLFTALTYAAIYIGGRSVEDVPLRCLKAIAMHDLAVVTYCCLFGLMSLFTRWALVLGILYTVIFEGLIANLAFGIRLITVIYYGRSIAFQSLQFNLTERGRTVNLAAEAWQFDASAIADMISIQTCIAILVVASLAFAGIASFVCSRREFHVKTPEGN